MFYLIVCLFYLTTTITITKFNKFKFPIIGISILVNIRFLHFFLQNYSIIVSKSMLLVEEVCCEFNVKIKTKCTRIWDRFLNFNVVYLTPKMNNQIFVLINNYQPNSLKKLRNIPKMVVLQNLEYSKILYLLN